MDTLLAADLPTLTLTDGGQAQWRFSYDEGRIAELKAAIEGVTWNGVARAWTVRVRAANIRAIVGFARAHGFAGIDGAQAVQERLFAQARETIAASKAADADFTPPATLRGTLLPFQRAGVAFALAAKRCLLADEMGLGKTVEALVTLEALGAFPAVIVCPAGLMRNWERECAEWIPHRTLRVVDTAAGVDAACLDTKCQPQPDLVITSYDIMVATVEALRTRRNQAVIFDEGHLLKNPKCQRSIAARKLRTRVPVRMILTGTPVLNSPSELLHPLRVLGRLEDLGGWEHFVERYCAARQVERKLRGSEEKRKFLDITGSSNLAELAGRLRATCMVRRRKREVLPELPPRRLAVLPVELDNRAEYDQAQADVLRWIAARAGKDPAFRARIAGLDPEAQLAAVLARCEEAVNRAASAEELVRLNALRGLAARGKTAVAREWIENFAATGEKLVVFGWHQETLRGLAQVFRAPVIDGDTPVGQRQGMVDRFQHPTPNGRTTAPALHSPLFVNLQAGGVGLTLTAASHCLVLELPWTRALLDQAVARLHRIGQRSAVTAWLLLGRRTIDYPIWTLVQRKGKIAEEAVR